MASVLSQLSTGQNAPVYSTSSGVRCRGFDDLIGKDLEYFLKAMEFKSQRRESVVRIVVLQQLSILWAY